MLPVILTNSAGLATPTLAAIVDTGADGTVAPFSLLRAAGFRAGRQRRNLLSGIPGAANEIVLGFLLNLRIGPIQLSQTDVFGSRQITDVILGRNVLNQLVFTDDGPRRVIDLIEAMD